uniref:MLLT6, PHD finger containing n=1 Tax=Tetraodon nigroviridis TaxID=99883 RepID=H3D9G6_TETNG
LLHCGNPNAIEEGAAHRSSMREMVGGCCVCSDERGWAENPLVYCDGHGCNVAVHQGNLATYQVVPKYHFCSQSEDVFVRMARVGCRVFPPPQNDKTQKWTRRGHTHSGRCPFLFTSAGAFPRIQSFLAVLKVSLLSTSQMFTCYICEDHGRESKASCGACMTCNRQGCRQCFHVTCAQMAGLLCEEEGPGADNVKYCGYCKHHYNKMQKKLRSAENASSAFSHSTGRSSSPPQDKHHHHKQRKSHKDKSRQKERHKKSSDSLASSVTTSIIDKSFATAINRIFHSLLCLKTVFFFSFFPPMQVSCSHHSMKDSEGKSKKLSSHSHSHRSKKTGSTGKSSSSSCSSSPFNTGTESWTRSRRVSLAGSSLTSSQDFHQFSSSSRLEHDHEGGDNDHGGEERKERRKRPAVLNSSGGKIRKISSGDYKFSKSLSKSSQLSTPPILEEAGLEDKAMPPTLPRERRHRGSKKSSHGPGRPRGSKNRGAEGRGASPPPPPHTGSFSTGRGNPLLSSGEYAASTTRFLKRQITSRGNIIAGSRIRRRWGFYPKTPEKPKKIHIFCHNSGPSGIYSSLKDPLTLGGGVCSTLGGGGMCSTSLSSGLLQSHVSSLSLPSVSSVSNTQVATIKYNCSSTAYSLTSAQPFASCLSSAPTLAPILNQAQTSLPEPDLDDCRFPCQGNSPRSPHPPRSPMSCLPLLFDQRDGLGPGVRNRPENVPPVSSHIELLLEKHGNGEMGINSSYPPLVVVEILQSLHSLQQENQRLQDQILGLTAKKERLQLLNTELAVPFPPHSLSGQGSVHTSAQINFLSPIQDPLSTNKSSLSKSSFLNDTSFVTSSEELLSGSPSRSSSSLSFQSTPPSHQSPASFSQPLLNGLGRSFGDGAVAVTQPNSSSLPTVSGLMASVAGLPQLNMNGVLGGLNGVIHSPLGNASQATLPALRPQPPPVNPQALAQGFAFPKSVSPSSLLSEQQKQLLLEQQQQLQQILTSQNFTPEQQVVVCQILQQQQQRELQRLTLSGALTSTPNSPKVAQSPSLLSSATASPM